MAARCRLFVSLLLICVGLSFPLSAAAEPLRLLVPSFVGPEPLSQQVRTTIYFEMIKAFRATDRPDKGAWILYGQEPLAAASHDAVLAAAEWPSVRADLAVWGQAYRYDDGAVVQLYLTLAPLLKQRQVRPELWTLALRDRDGRLQRLQLDIPGRYYEFEPLLLRQDALVRLESPDGMPLYSTRQGGQQVGRLQGVMRFYEIYQDALLVASAGIKGWVHTPPIARRDSEAIAFSKGMVRLLRGDYAGAQESFSRVLANPHIPQNLRIHSLIYRGLAKEQKGTSGREEFQQALALNRLDKTAAAYLLMSRLADIARYQQRADSQSQRQAVTQFESDLQRTRVLFGVHDPWLQKVAALF